MIRPLIFLDIDGVLNNHATIAASKGSDSSLHSIDPACQARLQAFIDETQAEVVLSSTWRLFDNAREALRDIGLSWIGMTPDLNRLPDANGLWTEKPRSSEILAWLHAHPECANRPTFIIDDDGDARVWDHPNVVFIHTQFSTGLTDSHVHTMRRWLAKMVSA